MKKQFLSIFIGICHAFTMMAQSDSTFCRTIYNAEEDIYIVMDFNKKNVVIPGQDFMGEMSGYIGDYKDFRKWFILESEVVDSKTAKISLSNDEGSEDLEATISVNKDGTYTLRQDSGSTLRTARNRKWHKLPKTLIFTTKRPKK